MSLHVLLCIVLSFQRQKEKTPVGRSKAENFVLTKLPAYNSSDWWELPRTGRMQCYIAILTENADME